ncbi:MAG: EamA family transporter [Clostridia bacterium]|nr:EamA family transporter [Clostridia bacterium]
MIYLLLAILASSLVSIVMRLTKAHVKNETSLLAVNYLTCIAIAGAYMGAGNTLPGAGGAWPLGLGAVTGALYLAGFILLQWSVGKNGVVLSSTFMKLGLLVPIVCSIVFLHETPAAMQVIGFVLAVAAVLLINSGKGGEAARSRGVLILLLLTCGTGDFMSKVYEVLGPKALSDQFLFYTFVFAFVLCLALMIRKKEKPGIKELCWGAALGLPNYFSARFILGALGQGIPAVIVYPTFSVATMVVLTIVGVVFFREKLSRREWIGLAMILAALIFLNI